MTRRRLHFKLYRVIPSFQLCRSRKAGSSVHAPTVIHRLSPINPKAREINFPHLPGPPPSTPTTPSIKRHVSRKLLSSLGCCCKGTPSCSHCLDASEWSFESEPKKLPLKNYIRTLSFSDDSNGDMSPFTATEKRIKKFKERKSILSSGGGDTSGCFTSDGVAGGDNAEESESLLFPSTSFSCDSSYEFSHNSLETFAEIKKLKRQSSKKEETVSYSTIPSPVRSAVLRRMISCTADGKVKESVAVVKRSEDPYEDFKRSMMEMILEKQIYEDKELEELLRCFLSLNSRQYHGVIVEAFAEIWEVLFTEAPAVKKGASMKEFEEH